MKKRLLLVGLLVTGLSVMAQNVFNYGFEEALPDGKLEYINFLEGDTHDSISTDMHSGALALKLQNASIAGNSWERALKVRDLTIEPNTSYRVSFWVKGDKTYSIEGGAQNATSNIQARLMVGEEDADVPYVGVDNTAFGYTLSGFEADTWKKMSMVFFYTADSVQSNYYKTLKGDTAVLNLKHFLCLNVYSPGTYNIDDISIDKSSINGISFFEDMLKVDFGYAVNAAALREGEDYGIAVLPKECVTVKKAGVALSVLSVEVQEGGFFIFLENDVLSATDAADITVSFTNPTDPEAALLYTAKQRPFSWDATSDMRVLDFVDEGVTYDINLSASSSQFYPPLLKSTLPENESFDMPVNTRTFAFNYNKNIDCASVVGTIVGPITGTGVVNGSLALQLQETGFSKTLTFTVPEGAVLGEGDYSVTLTEVYSEIGIPAENNDVIYFTVGSSAAAEVDTLMVPWTKATTTSASVPDGWKRLTTNDGAIVNGGSTGVAGARLMHFLDGGDIEAGFYHSARDKDTVHLMYGTYPESRLHFKPGRYSVSFYSAYWNTGSMNNKVVFDMLITDTTRTKELFAERNIGSAFNCNDGTHGANDNSNVVVSGAAFHDYSVYVSEEGDYVLDFVGYRGWDAALIGGLTIYSVPSSAAKYKGLLSTALKVANTALSAADSSMYDGEAKTALTTLIAANTTVTYTAPSQYVAAADQLNDAAAAMDAHRALVDAHFARIATYYVNTDSANAVLNRFAATKYESLDAYSKLQTVVDLYKGLALTNDDSLKVANDSLSFYTSLMKNYVGTAIPAMTYRLRLAVKLAKTIGVDSTKLIPAQNAMTDDDAIANDLNRRIKDQLHSNIALGTLKFGESWQDSTLVDSLDVTCFMKNPNFYSTYTVNNLDMNTFPGWVTSAQITGGGLGATASGSNPVVDTHASIFNTAVDSFEQTVTGMPAGVFNIHMRTRTAQLPSGWTTDDIKDVLYCYLIVGSDTLTTPFVVAGWGLPSALNTSFKNVKITEGSFTLGVSTNVKTGYTPSLFWGDPAISMVNKADGYTYVGLKDVEAVKGAVKEVYYYNIQGIRVPRLVKGLNIVKTVYDNGTVDVQKIMMK